MKIGFPGFLYGDGNSGISTYVSSLLDNIINVSGDFECNLHLTHSQGKHFKQNSPKLKKWFSNDLLINPLVNIAWHSTILPLIAKMNNYDIVHIPSIRRLPCFKTTKLIVTVHDLAVMNVKNKYGLLRDFYHKKILSKLIFNADHIITVSVNTKNDLIHFFNYPEEKISVIYPGIDHGLFKPKDIQKKHNIVYVSRIEHPGKNHIRLIEAFEKFKMKNFTDHQLIFAGADWNGSEVVKKFAKDSKVASDIHFYGFITDKELVSLYSSADLMVFPSLYEGFGLPVIEAMACGSAVICSNSSSLKEIAKDHALLFDPENIDDIAASIEKGLSSSYKEKTIEDGKKYALNFSWERAAKEVINTYEKTLS